MEKSKEELIEIIKNWQEDKNFHKLTCGECREELFGSIEGDDVVLKCKNNHIQVNIPKVIKYYVKNQ